MYRTYDFICLNCGRKWCALVNTNEEEKQICRCGEEMIRTFSIPHVRTEKLSASFVDGQRANSKEFVELRRQNKLEDIVEDEWSTPEEKKEAQTELSILNKKGK